MNIKNKIFVILLILMQILTIKIHTQDKNFINNKSEFYCKNYAYGFSEFTDVNSGDMDCIEYFIDYYLFPSQHFMEFR